MKLWQEGIREPNKTIVCGHFRADWGHINIHKVDPNTSYLRDLFSPFKDEGIICLDSHVPNTRFLNVEVLEVEDFEGI